MLPSPVRTDRLNRRLDDDSDLDGDTDLDGRVHPAVERDVREPTDPERRAGFVKKRLDAGPDGEFGAIPDGWVIEMHLDGEVDALEPRCEVGKAVTHGTRRGWRGWRGWRGRWRPVGGLGGVEWRRCHLGVPFLSAEDAPRC